MIVEPWGMTGSKSTVVENKQRVPERASSSVRLEGRVHKWAQGVAKLKSQVRDHDGEQNESILTTAPQNLAGSERLVNIYWVCQVLNVVEGAKL